MGLIATTGVLEMYPLGHLTPHSPVKESNTLGEINSISLKFKKMWHFDKMVLWLYKKREIIIPPVIKQNKIQRWNSAQNVFF